MCMILLIVVVESAQQCLIECLISLMLVSLHKWLMDTRAGIAHIFLTKAHMSIAWTFHHAHMIDHKQIYLQLRGTHPSNHLICYSVQVLSVISHFRFVSYCQLQQERGSKVREMFEAIVINVKIWWKITTNRTEHWKNRRKRREWSKQKEERFEIERKRN